MVGREGAVAPDSTGAPDSLRRPGALRTLAILVAAGRGERMGAARPKAFLALQGQSLLLRASRAFDAAASVDALIAVVPAEEVANTREMLAPIGKPCQVVAGGERRQDSVRQGLRAAPAGFTGVVLVHDAARPLVDPTLIDAVAQQAHRQGAAIPALPLVDTIKRVEAGHVVETLERSVLFAAQTPQGFRFSLLQAAYDQAYRDGVTLTDEAMAVERLGASVAVLAGSAQNRKLTTPEDLVWAEAQLLAPPQSGPPASAPLASGSAQQLVMGAK